MFFNLLRSKRIIGGLENDRLWKFSKINCLPGLHQGASCWGELRREGLTALGVLLYRCFIENAEFMKSTDKSAGTAPLSLWIQRHQGVIQPPSSEGFKIFDFFGKSKRCAFKGFPHKCLVRFYWSKLNQVYYILCMEIKTHILPTHTKFVAKIIF